MYIILNRKKIIRIITLILLIIPIFTIMSSAESDISQEISKFSNKENVHISDFKEFREDKANKGYDIFILDLQDGFTIPNLIQDENINKIKELVGKESNISLETINEDIYPELFDEYNVEFLECKDDRNFLFFTKSNLVELKIEPSNDNIEVSVDGKLPVKTNEESIQLKRGNIYNITVYKDGNEKTSKVVDLTDYHNDTYEINIGVSIIHICIVILVVIFALIGLKIIKNKKQFIRDVINRIKRRWQDIFGAIENTKVQSIEYIPIQGTFYRSNELLKNEQYEDILRVKIIKRLQNYLKTVKSRLKIVSDNNFRIANCGNNLDTSHRSDINKIKNDLEEINLSLETSQRDIEDLMRDINDIKNEQNEKKIIKVNNIVELSKDIYLKLDYCYYRLEESKSNQYYIENAISSSIQPVYVNQSYIDIENDTKEILKRLIDYVIKRDGEIDRFKDQIKKQMDSISISVDNLYENMEKQVSKICKSIENNNISMINALNDFDSNIINNLNLKISFLNEQLQNIDNNSMDINDGINILQESLTSQFKEAIEMKLNALEDIVPTLVDKVNSQYIDDSNFEVCNQYEEKLDEISLGYLRTAEYLYHMFKSNRNIKLYDYSNIYIMYSKLLEAELAKCVDYKYLNNSNNKSLGKILRWLETYKSKTWEKFLKELEDNDIRNLRNYSAHSNIEGNSTIIIDDVEKIRSFLFEKTESNNMCWIDFIIKQQKIK